MSTGTPAAEQQIDAALIAGLLADQHPDLAGQPLAPLEAGWDNVMFRLGDGLLVRVPRRAASAELVAHEQDWLPGLAPLLPLPIPAPLRAGRPGRGFPWRWSVLPWLPGEAADERPPEPGEAGRFGAFLRALHQPAPAGAPANPYRGVPLPRRAPAVEERLGRLAAKTGLVTPALRRAWQEALEAPIDVAPTWIHGDLHTRNVLVHGGRLSAVIDWGDIAAGDRATDLAAIWMLFADPAARAAALAASGEPSEATLRRARGWAILFGAMLLDTGLVDHPRHAAIGAAALKRVQE
jgi:aminoglycoside phosphotransferase (APT) family kinase protein